MNDVLRRYLDLVPKIKSLAREDRITLIRYGGRLFVEGKMEPTDEQLLAYFQESKVDLKKFKQNLGEYHHASCLVSGINFETYTINQVMLAIAESL